MVEKLRNMTFTVRPLKGSGTDRALAVERTARTAGRDVSAATADMIHEVEKGRGFFLGGVLGCGKTALLNKVSLHFNWHVANVVALGPLSLGLVTQNGINSLGAQLRDWFRENETRLPFTLPSSYEPTHADSLRAWLPLLKSLISLRNAETLLLLLDDLDSVPLGDREALLQNILDSSWAKIANQLVLGCAENLLDDEISGDETYASGRTGPQEALAVSLNRETAEDLLNALIIHLGAMPESQKKAKGKEGGGGKKSGTSKYYYVKPGKPIGSGKPEAALEEDVATIIYRGGGVDKSKALGAPEENVDATVYAPGQASPGNSFLVQVFAHLPEQAWALAEIAKEAAPEAKKRVGSTLPKKIHRGTELTFNLTMPELEIDEPSQSCIWRGRPVSVQFGVTVPKDSKPRTTIGVVRVCESSVPIGRLRFEFKIVTETAAASAGSEPTTTSNLARYKQAFISYSSKDRSEVLKRVQMLDAAGPRYFMDQVNLERGDKWETLLYKYLDESDVVFLFWSKAASESAWVKKEIEYAIKRQAGNDEAPPEIMPIPIEGPPPAKAPAELEYLHFDDNFMYFINPKKAGG